MSCYVFGCLVPDRPGSIMFSEKRIVFMKPAIYELLREMEPLCCRLERAMLFVDALDLWEWFADAYPECDSFALPTLEWIRSYGRELNVQFWFRRCDYYYY